MTKRERVFVVTDANARSGNKKGGGDTCSKVLGAYGQQMLNEIDELPLRFAEKTNSLF